jgi:hypothetical protein
VFIGICNEIVTCFIISSIIIMFFYVSATSENAYPHKIQS